MYRDLKAENVLLAADGHIKLADFGLAAKIEPEAQGRRTVAGTPQMLAPEIFLHRSQGYGASADWWALGIFVSEMLLGETPLNVAVDSLADVPRLVQAFERNDHLEGASLGTLSDPAASAVRGLLTVDVASRLGCSGGASQLSAHAFFSGLDFKQVENREVEAPLKGQLVPGGKNARATSLRASGRRSRVSGRRSDSGTPPRHSVGGTRDLTAAENRRHSRRSSDYHPDNWGEERRKSSILVLAEQNGVLIEDEMLAVPAPGERFTVGGAVSPRHTTDVNETTLEERFVEFMEEDAGRDTAFACLLCDAAARGDLPELRALLTAGAKVDQGDYDQRTALHLVCSEGNAAVASFLIDECGANIGVVDRWGSTPLDDAVRHRHTDLAEALRARGGASGPGARMRRQTVSTDLCTAAANGDIELLRMLIANDSASRSTRATTTCAPRSTSPRARGCSRS